MGQPAQKEQFDVLIGKTISNRYRLDAKLGVGAMGAVFQAFDLENNKTVAIKVISPALVTDEKFIKRFEREADLGKLLKHPNIVGVEEFGQTEHRLFFIIMEFVPGETLKNCLEKEGVLSPKRSLELLTPLCQALEFAHKHNVLHRDLKPENILVSKTSDGKEIIKLADFGIAKRTDLSKTKDQMLTVEGEIFGTPHYMSPEQVLAQKLRPTTDVYSVGVILYQMLSGKLPIEHSKAQQLLIIKVSQDIAPISRTHPFVSPLFDPILQKALTRSPSDRYQSAIELLEDIKETVLRLDTKPKINLESTEKGKSYSPENREKTIEANQNLKANSQKIKPKTDSLKISTSIKTSEKPNTLISNSKNKSVNNKTTATTSPETMIIIGIIVAIILVVLLAFWVFFFR
ncbi:MAG: serine/threonine protein kinase [Acidobacteria bacterium]|nr:serine/threonine protein kinase [Acidobacteriota bacterium]